MRNEQGCAGAVVLALEILTATYSENSQTNCEIIGSLESATVGIFISWQLSNTTNWDILGSPRKLVYQHITGWELLHKYSSFRTPHWSSSEECATQGPREAPEGLSPSCLYWQPAHYCTLNWPSSLPCLDSHSLSMLLGITSLMPKNLWLGVSFWRYPNLDRHGSQKEHAWCRSWRAIAPCRGC